MIKLYKNMFALADFRARMHILNLIELKIQTLIKPHRSRQNK